MSDVKTFATAIEQVEADKRHAVADAMWFLMEELDDVRAEYCITMPAWVAEMKQQLELLDRSLGIDTGDRLLND